MNLAVILRQCLKILSGSEEWEAGFDVSKAQFRASFLALILSVPCFYVCGAASQIHYAGLMGREPTYPSTLFFIILLIYNLMFVGVAYGVSLVFDRMDRFRPWVIIRHWTIFFMSLLAAMIYGLYLMGTIPFSVANSSGLMLYVGTLFVDIRLAQKIAGFNWSAAIFIGCVIAAVGLSVVLMGVSQISH